MNAGNVGGPIVAFLVLAFVGACDQSVDALTEDEVRRLDAVPESSLRGEDIIYSTVAPRDATDNKRKEVIEALIGAMRRYSCGRHQNNPCNHIWDHDADPSNPTIRPAQQVLLYVYGAKNPHVRSKAHSPSKCPEELYAFDCSGLVARAAADAGITIPHGVKAQSDPKSWSMPSEWNLQMEVVDGSDPQTGDIAIWTTDSHIGVIEEDKSIINIISSTGSIKGCLENKTPPRGPRSMTLAEMISKIKQPNLYLRLSRKPKFIGAFSISGPASVSNCRGNISLVGNATIVLNEVPRFIMDATERIKTDCFEQSYHHAPTVSLSQNKKKLKGHWKNSFNCVSGCTKGEQTLTIDLDIVEVGGRQQLQGTLKHTNQNDGGFAGSATGNVKFEPEQPPG